MHKCIAQNSVLNIIPCISVSHSLSFIPLSFQPIFLLPYISSISSYLIIPSTIYDSLSLFSSCFMSLNLFSLLISLYLLFPPCTSLLPPQLFCKSFCPLWQNFSFFVSAELLQLNVDVKSLFSVCTLYCIVLTRIQYITGAELNQLCLETIIMEETAAIPSALYSSSPLLPHPPFFSAPLPTFRGSACCERVVLLATDLQFHPFFLFSVSKFSLIAVSRI